MTDRAVNSSEGVGRTSSSLLDRVRAQDQAAWERLVHLYSPLVYRWCCRAGLQTADAADVGQEVFRAVVSHMADFRRDGAGDSFRAWLRTITRTKLLNFFRAQGPGNPAAGGSEAQRLLYEVPAKELDDPGPEGQAEETRILFRQALDLIRSEFNEQTWKAFWSVVVEEQPPADVAADLQVSTNVVYLAKSRILRRLREEFADLLDVEGPSVP